MEQLLVILVAASVGALVWAVLYSVTSSTEGKKRKIHQRLSSEGRSDTGARAVRPLTLSAQAGSLPRLLKKLPLLSLLQRRVSQAFPHLSLGKFFVVAAVASAFVSTMTGLLGGTPMALMGAAAGAYVPFFVIFSKRARRQRKLTQQLPDALDFLSRALRAGQSFSTGLQMMAEELPPPLSFEFRRCYDQHSLGQPIEEALRDTAIRLESADFAFFATAVAIQRQSGGDMAEVLRNISHMVRQRLRLQQSVKSKTAEGRFTGYIMVAFPIVMFCITWFLNPERGSVMLNTQEGHVLLGVAIGLQVLGIFLIRKITTVRV
jgi:tight adherence protein B